MRLLLPGIALLAGLAGTVLWEGAAKADCARAQVTSAPPSGAVLPPDPVVHLFLPQFLAEPSLRVQVSVDGQEVPAAVTRVGTSPAFATLRVAIPTGRSARRVTVSLDEGHYPHELSYRIDRRAARPPRAAVRLREARRVVSHWTCSYTDAWMLTLSAAPAYRVDWAPSREAFDRGEQQTTIFPGHSNQFWRADLDEPAGHVGLGHLSCFDHTIPAQAIERPLWIKVTALHPDGSESRPWPAPRLLSSPADEPGADEPPPAIEPAPTVEIETTPPAPPATTAATATIDEERPRTRCGMGHVLWLFLLAPLTLLVAPLLLGALLALRRAHRRRITRLTAL